MNSSGIRYLDRLMMGYDLMQWLQAEYAVRGQALRLGSAFSPGWVGGTWSNGRQDYGWELWDDSGKLSTRASDAPSNRLRKTTVPFLGVEPFGSVLEVDPAGPMLDNSGDPVSVPNDNTWYTLVATFKLDTREPGTLTLSAGSASVVGVGTAFTRYSSTPEATNIRVDAAESIAGNEGTYPVQTVIDDTHMTLHRTAPAAEAGVPFHVQGQFFSSGVPTDPDCHLNSRIAWVRRARTTTAPTDGLIAYDVKRAVDGTFTMIDRRHAQVLRVNGGRNVGYLPTFPSRYDDTIAGQGAGTLLGASTIYTCAANEIVSHLALTGCNEGGWTVVGNGTDQPTCLLAGVMVENTSTLVDRFVVKVGIPWIGPDNTRWYNPANGGAINVTSETGLLGIALTALPLGTGFTHLAFYIDSAGNLKTKTSVDNGANWVGPATIWTPPSTDVLGAGGVAVLLTRLGRLIAVGSYKPAAGAAELRYIYSDDYGTTWTTNSNNGFDILENAAEEPALVEDDAGNIWLAYRSGGDTGSAETFLIRGAGVNDPTPDASVPGDGWTFGDPPAGAAAGRKLVALVAAPGGGNIAAYYTSQADIGAYTSWLGVASLSEGQVLHDDGKTIVLYSDPLGTAYANPEPIATYVGHNGLVWVAALSAYDPAGSARVRSYVSTLQPLERSHAFLPGY